MNLKLVPILWSAAGLVLLHSSMAKPLGDPSSSLVSQFENCVEADLMMIEELKEQLLQRINFESVENKLHLSFGLLQDDWHRLLLLERKLPAKSPLKNKLVRAYRLLITALYQAHVPPLNEDQETVFEDLQPSTDDFPSDLFNSTPNGKSKSVDNKMESSGRASGFADEDNFFEEETQHISVMKGKNQSDIIEKFTESSEHETATYHTSTSQYFHDKFFLRPTEEIFHVPKGQDRTHDSQGIELVEGHEEAKETSNSFVEATSKYPSEDDENKNNPTVTEKIPQREVYTDISNFNTTTGSYKLDGILPKNDNLEINLNETFTGLKSDVREDFGEYDEKYFSKSQNETKDINDSKEIKVVDKDSLDPISTFVENKSADQYLPKLNSDDKLENSDFINQTSRSTEEEKETAEVLQYSKIDTSFESNLQMNASIQDDPRENTTNFEDEEKLKILKTATYLTPTNANINNVNTSENPSFELRSSIETPIIETAFSSTTTENYGRKHTHIQRITQPHNTVTTVNIKPIVVSEHSIPNASIKSTFLEDFTGPDVHSDESKAQKHDVSVVAPNEETNVDISDTTKSTTSNLLQNYGFQSISMTLTPVIANSDILHQVKQSHKSNFNHVSRPGFKIRFPASTEDQLSDGTSFNFDDSENMSYDTKDSYEPKAEPSQGTHDSLNIMEESREIMTSEFQKTNEYNNNYPTVGLIDRFSQSKDLVFDKHSDLENYNKNNSYNVDSDNVKTTATTQNGGLFEDITERSDPNYSPINQENSFKQTNNETVLENQNMEDGQFIKQDRNQEQAENIQEILNSEDEHGENLDGVSKKKNRIENIDDNLPPVFVDEIQKTTEEIKGIQNTTKKPFESHDNNAIKPQENFKENNNDNKKYIAEEGEVHEDSKKIYKTTNEKEENQKNSNQSNEMDYFKQTVRDTPTSLVEVDHTEAYTVKVMMNQNEDTSVEIDKPLSTPDSRKVTDEPEETDNHPESPNGNLDFTDKMESATTSPEETTVQTYDYLTITDKTDHTQKNLNAAEESHSLNIETTLNPPKIEDRNTFDEDQLKPSFHDLDSEDTKTEQNVGSTTTGSTTKFKPPFEPITTATTLRSVDYFTIPSEKHYINLSEKPVLFTPTTLDIKSSGTEETSIDQDLFSTTPLVRGVKTGLETKRFKEYSRNFTMIPPKSPKPSSTTEKINHLMLYSDRPFMFKEFQPKLRKDCRNGNDCVQVDHLQYKEPPGVENIKSGLAAETHHSKLPKFEPDQFWEKVRALRRNRAFLRN